MGYEIFLSYAHDDAEKYGKAYIDEIKRQIEASLDENDIVFLDADALKLGNEWNSQIQSCLNQSKVFVCLLSENYVKSDYCTRERLWWTQKEIARGRLHKTTLPMFYVALDHSADEKTKQQLKKLSHLQNDIALAPWFPNGEKCAAEELVKRRLEKAGLLTRIQEIRKNSAAAKNTNNIPPYNQKFVGRIEELCKIRGICSHSGMTAKSIPVLHGEPGCGKSEISFTYAHGYASEYPGGRFLIPMAHVTNWSSAWLNLAIEIDKKSGSPIYQVLGLSDEDRKRPPEEFAKAVSQKMWLHINNSEKTLILLDNIDCMELLEDSGLNGLFATGEMPDGLDIIATTRNTPQLDSCSQAIAVPIGNLGEEAALELLRLHCEKSPFNTAPPEENDPTTADAKELLAFLEYHAWSVEIIAGYLSKESRFGATLQNVLKQLKKNFEIKSKYKTLRDIPDCMDKLLQSTVERLQALELGSEILEIAGAAAMFAPDAVGVNFLKMLWQKRHGKKACSYADSWLWAWETLKDYHLISEENGGLSRMHRITHSFFRKYCSEKQLELVTDLCELIEPKEMFEFSSQDAEAIAGLAQFILEQSWKEKFFLPVIIWIEKILLEWYRVEKSQTLLDQLEKFVEKCDSRELIATLQGIRGYYFYKCTNQYEKALVFYNQSLKIFQSVAPNHSVLAKFYNNIGLVYYCMGKYEHALEKYEKALSIQQAILPENHPALASSYNNIGNVYNEMGEYERALEIHTKTLKIWQSAVPENHQKLAAAYSNLGSTYCRKEDYERALENYNRALTILKTILPEGHLKFASLYNNLGIVYDIMKKYEQALELYTRALSILKVFLPDGHLDLVSPCNNIALVYQHMNDYEKALEFYTESLLIRQSTLPENHPDLAESYRNIGWLYGKMEDYEQALENLRKALEIKQNILPEKHLEIAELYKVIGLVYIGKNNYDIALSYLQKAVQIFVETLGENHPQAKQCIEIVNFAAAKLQIRRI